MNLPTSEDWVSPPSSCCSQSEFDENNTAPSSVSSGSSDLPPRPVLQSLAVSRWEIAVPYSRTREDPTDITIRHTANRFNGDPSRDISIAATSHVDAIDDLTNLLNDLVPNDEEPRDPDLLTYVRNIIRISERFTGMLVGQGDGVDGDENAFRLTVDLDTAM